MRESESGRARRTFKFIGASFLFAGALCVAGKGGAQVSATKTLAHELVELVEAIMVPAARDGTPDEAAAEPVRLPRNLVFNTPQNNRTWYRIRFQHDAQSNVHQAIYFRALYAHLSIALNDHFLGQTGTLDQIPPRSWNQMRLFEIPTAFLRDGENQLVIEAGGDGAWSFSPPLIGPLELARNRYILRVILTGIAPFGVGVIVAILGAFAIMLWGYRRREPLYAYYGLANLLCGLHTVWWALPAPLLPLLQNRLLWVAAFMFWVSIFMIFFVRFTGEHWKRFERVLWGFGLSSFPVLYLASEFGFFSEVSIAWRALGLSIVALALAIVARFAWRQKRADGFLLLATGLLALGFGIHDWWTGQSLYGLYTRVALVPYVGIAFVLLFGWLLATRFNRDVDTLEKVNESLTESVNEKTRELAANFERLRIAEREQSSIEERSRLLRDMHDGLGGKLMTTLRALEHGAVGNRAAAELVRDCIDELRLTVDAYDQTDGDLAGLLANLRYRLGDRLKAAGLEVDWRVADTPPVPVLIDNGRELMRIIQEALNNILKHADATRVIFETAIEGDCIRVTLTDNGCGFVVPALGDTKNGQGITNMRLHAENLGGRFSVESSDSSTAVTVRLPV